MLIHHTPNPAATKTTPSAPSRYVRVRDAVLATAVRLVDGVLDEFAEVPNELDGDTKGGLAGTTGLVGDDGFAALAIPNAIGAAPADTEGAGGNAGDTAAPVTSGTDESATPELLRPAESAELNG